MFQNSNISFRLLSIKVAIKRHPVEIISALTLSIIVTITYFIRIAEGPAYQKHSTYIWDQMWIVYVTLTTVCILLAILPASTDRAARVSCRWAMETSCLLLTLADLPPVSLQSQSFSLSFHRSACGPRMQMTEN
eukprot:768066-Hanusia_phi.AAC.4